MHNPKEPANIPSAAPKEAAGTACPVCKARDLVQAHVPGLFLLWFRKGARCLVCGRRFFVSHAEFQRLRKAALDEPYERTGDKYEYMQRLPMRPVHAVVCIAGALMGLVFGVWLGMRYSLLLLPVGFFPVLWMGWWLGRWLSPPTEAIPGKCPRCRYDLTGLTSGRCPECGATLFSDDDGDLRPEKPVASAVRGP
jgi:hypothetical protein